MKLLAAVSLAAVLLANSAAASPLLGGADDIAAARARASTPRARRGAPHPAAAGLLASLWASLAARNASAASAAATAPLSAGERDATDCALDLVSYEMALALQPERYPLADVFYALSLDSNCGLAPPPGSPYAPLHLAPWTAVELAKTCLAGATFYVDAARGDDGAAGTLQAPLKTIARALAATRAARAPGAGTACVVLRGGTHFLGASTQVLTAADSGLVLTGYDGDGEPEAWISGGSPLLGLAWAPYAAVPGVFVASVPAGSVASVPGLQTLSPLRRYFRAQAPNFDLEVDGRRWIDSRQPGVISRYISPPNYGPVTQFNVTLFPSLKNDSTMQNYNNYCSGSGGPVALWQGGIDGERGWSYWGGNCCDGGGAGQDASYFKRGNLGFPMGMVWNASSPAPLPNFANWVLPPRADWGERLENLPTYSAYQDPGWFSSNFAITGVDAAALTLNFSSDGVWPYGGFQGGRNWWGSDMGNDDNRLNSGPWYVENVMAELDAPGEFYFNATTRQLFLFYNASGAPPADFALVASQLEVFFNLSGSAAAPVADVTFAGIAFRDQRTALLDPWLVPSGGDWSLRRAGALHFEGTERATVSGCAFVRTDANAIFLAAYNRNATIEHTEFQWLGMSAVAEFGFTAMNDGTAALQPWGTVMAFNKVHEIGLYEVQSSALFLGKTPLTRLEGNLLFNGPRAMVNVNDGFGGGHNFTRNLVFNTCRQSGDHGPINSWDRQPFLTTIASGGASQDYNSLHSAVEHNMLNANYGGAQGFDNDDGSSWYDHYENFVRGAGFKMDYGGHDSLFHSNAIYTTNGWNFINVAGFIQGHEDLIYDNDYVHTTQEHVDSLFDNCREQLPVVPIRGWNNRFYTPLGNATAQCDCCGEITLTELASVAPVIEANFTASTLPPGATIVAWARQKVGLPPAA